MGKSQNCDVLWRFVAFCDKQFSRRSGTVRPRALLFGLVAGLLVRFWRVVLWGWLLVGSEARAPLRPSSTRHAHGGLPDNTPGRHRNLKAEFAGSCVFLKCDLARSRRFKQDRKWHFFFRETRPGSEMAGPNNQNGSFGGNGQNDPNGPIS